MSNLIKPLIDALRPKRKRGAIPLVTPCPYCSKSMSQTDLAAHTPGCKSEFNNAPPQAPDFMHDAGGGYNADESFIQT